MLLLTLATLLLSFQSSNAQTVDANGVSLQDKIDNMERLMLMPQGLELPVDTCDKLPADKQPTGRQTSAEWVRIVFHDAATANVAAGTGGLDASIGFESNRGENAGGAFFVNDTLGTFNRFFSVYTPMADVIGLGLFFSMISCDPSATRLIKLRVGRTDASAAGPTGVPEPQDNLVTTLAKFSKAGFNQSEAIAAVACGHSLGSVAQIDFPDIIPASAVTDDNTHGTVAFDSTKAQFDNSGVVEYLDRTGTRGGPLVVGSNVTMRSDLRLFTADNNATITSIRNAAVFRERCFTLFEKMLDTVPSGTTLSSPVAPRPWSMVESHLDLTSAGAVTFEGTIRAVAKTGSVATTASYMYTTTGGGNTGTKTVTSSDFAGKNGLGTFNSFPFKDTLTSTSVTGISVQGSYTAPINLDFFIVKSLSRSIPFTTFVRVLVRVAIKTSLSTTTSSLTATSYYGTTQPLSTSFKLVKTTKVLTYQKTIGAYRIFQGVLNLSAGDALTQDTFVDVVFGSRRTPKLNSNFWDFCDNTDPLTCT